MSHQPDNIFAGTQVVSLVEVRGTNNSLVQFIETGALDAVRFQEILSRHGLQPAWQRFQKQFLSENP